MLLLLLASLDREELGFRAELVCSWVLLVDRERGGPSSSEGDRVDGELFGFDPSLSDGEGSVSEGCDRVDSDSFASTVCELAAAFAPMAGAADSSWFEVEVLAELLACFLTGEVFDLRDVPTASRFSVFGLAM